MKRTQTQLSNVDAGLETGGPAPSPERDNDDSVRVKEVSREHRLTFGVCVLLAILVWAVFGQTIRYEFVNYDDPGYVYKNPAITQGLSWDGILWTFTHVNTGTWFPLTDISHQLCWQLFGANAGGHHLVNVLLHAATAVCLFLALRRLTETLWPAAFVAAAFAIHPLRVESVAWVVERKDVLSGLFFMLTLWAWAGHVQKLSAVRSRSLSGDAPDVVPFAQRWTSDYFLALGCFALGLMSKSMLVTLPFVLLLLDYWPLLRFEVGTQAGGRPWPRIWLGLVLEKAPFFVLSGAISVLTLVTQKNAVLIAQSSTLLNRLGNATQAYVDYLGHMFWPANLAVVYPHQETSGLIGSAGGAVLILILITVGVVMGRRQQPWLLVGWLWYLGMLAPVIDIMQAGQNARADRYTYLPQIGLFILLTWGAVKFFDSGSYRRVWLGSAAVIILASLLLCARRQTTYWQDSISLWTHTLACTTKNSYAENNLGSALNNQDDWPEAARHFERALQIEPDYVDAHVNLGVALVNQGKREEAVPHFERALQLNPYSAEANYNLGDALTALNRPAEAVKYLEQALKSRPNYAEAHYDLGLVLASRQQWTDAIPHFEQALHFKVDEADAKYLLAIKLATQQRWSEAIELYSQVLRQKPDFAEAHNHLGVALASSGRAAEATQHFEQALALATAQGNTALAESIRARINPPPPTSPQSKTP